MMTFLLHSNFLISAKMLDDRRLGKQRVEAMQILHILQGKQKGFSKHPIVKSWRGYEQGLMYYINCCIHEWVSRGKTNNMEVYDLPDEIEVPWWVFWEPLIMSHRAMMVRKDPFYHGKFHVEDKYMKYGYIWGSDETWKTRHQPLEELTSPIPDYLIEPVYCSALLASGKNKGKRCNELCRDGKDRCKKHNKLICT